MSLALLVGMLLAHRILFAGLLVWSAAVGYSRIYLGVHYPGDILVGWLAGIAIGWTTYKLLIPILTIKETASDNT